MFAFKQLITLSLVAVASAVIVKRQVPPNCSRTYTVVEDDTCDKIAAAQGVSTYQFLNVNDGIINSGCTNLEIDKEYCLGITGEDCTQVHEVVSGDTCWDISVTYTTTVGAIIANNGMDVCDIYIGQVICVAPPPV